LFLCFKWLNLILYRNSDNSLKAAHYFCGVYLAACVCFKVSFETLKQTFFGSARLSPYQVILVERCGERQELLAVLELLGEVASIVLSICFRVFVPTQAKEKFV